MQDPADRVAVLIEEGLLPVATALRRARIETSIWTSIRWCRRGLRDGTRLESIKIGGRWMTSIPAVHRFLAAQARKSTVAEDPRQPASKAKDAASGYLESVGLGRKGGEE